MSKKESTMLGGGTLSKRNLWGYSMGGIGRDMTYTLVNTYLTLYALFTRNLSLSDYIIVSIIFIVCRIFDGCNDPLMGTLIEKTRTKFGKFKPWILIGMFSNIVITFAMFFVPLEGTSYVIFFAFMYLLWGITYTMNDISYWGMMPSLTSNAKDRNNLATIANVGAGLGMGACIIFIPFLTSGDIMIGDFKLAYINPITAYQVIAGVICLLFAGCQIMTCCVVQEKPLPPLTAEEIAEREAKKAEKEAFKQMSKEEKAQVREAKKAAKTEAKANGTKKDNALVAMFKIIFKNDQILVTAGSMLMYNIGSAIMNALYTFWVYLRFGYNGFLTLVFSALTGVSMAIVVLYPILTKKFTRKQLMKICITTICAGYLLMMIVALATGNLNVTGDSQTYLCAGVAICGAIASFGQALFYQVLTISMTNTIEYNDLKTGRRDEGIIFSVRPFMAKMGSSGVKLIEVIVLSAFGIQAVAQEISFVNGKEQAGILTETEAGAEIANLLSSAAKGTTEGLMVCMAIIPILFLIGAFILYMKKYKIDEKEYEEICAKIRERDGIVEEDHCCDCDCDCDCTFEDGQCEKHENGECCCCHDTEECDCDCHDHEENCTCGCCGEHTAPEEATEMAEDAE